MFYFYFIKFYQEVSMKKLLILLTLFLSLAIGNAYGASSPDSTIDDHTLIYIEDDFSNVAVCDLDGDTLVCVGEDGSAFELDLLDEDQLITMIHAPDVFRYAFTCSEGRILRGDAFC